MNSDMYKKKGKKRETMSPQPKAKHAYACIKSKFIETYLQPIVFEKNGFTRPGLGYRLPLSK